MREAGEESKRDIIRMLANPSTGTADIQNIYRELLDDKDESVQRAAIQVSGKMGMKDTAPKIRKLLSRRPRHKVAKESDYYKIAATNPADMNYRFEATRALIELDDFDSVDEIISRDELMCELGPELAHFGAKVLPKVIASSSKGWAQRRGAGGVIRKMRDEAALPALIELLDGPDLEFAISAEDALSEIGKFAKSATMRKDIAGQLEKRFASENKRLRTFAYRGLLNIGPDEYSPRQYPKYHQASSS
ncbi:MAG: hypothetical protein AAB425_10245, partial [Bdellovibrionota bacterium]